MHQHICVRLVWQSRCFLLNDLMLKWLEWSWNLKRRRWTRRSCGRNFLMFWWLKSTCRCLVKIYTSHIHVLSFGLFIGWRRIVVILMQLVFHFMGESYIEVVITVLLTVAGLLLLGNFGYPVLFLRYFIFKRKRWFQIFLRDEQLLLRPLRLFQLIPFLDTIVSHRKLRLF